MDISIRKAQPSDVETIQQFGSKLLDYEYNYDSDLDKDWPFSDAAKAKYLEAIQNRYVIIAEKDGQPVGFLVGRIIEPTSNDARQIKQAYLQNLYVDESFRQTGLGKILFTHFKKHCQDENVKRLNVSVLAANKAAVNFYNSVGFQTRTLNLFQEL